MSKRLLLACVFGAVVVAGLLPVIRNAWVQPAPEASDSPEVLLADPTTAIAHVDADRPAVRVEVTDITRPSPDIVELHLALTNRHSEVPLSLGPQFADVPDEHGSLSGAYLVADAGSRYYVLRESDGTPACSRDLEELGPGERRDAWIRFLAPSRSATRVALQLDGIPSIEDLELPAAE